MAVVSATTLKTSMSTAETAIDTLIATPTQANLNSAVSALDTVVVNSRDSRLLQSSDLSSRRIHNDFQQAAEGLRKNLQSEAAHHTSVTQPVGPSSIFRGLKRSHLAHGTPWATYKQTPTTD
jgi:hypothetical protein